MKEDTSLEILYNWVVQRIRKNKNVIIVVNGATGSGKSYACLRVAIDLSIIFNTPFIPKNNADFAFGKLLKKMYLPGNQEPGTVFVMEEVGSAGGGAASREWQSRANKFFFSFLQTSRHRNQVLIMNCPHFSYLDKGARELVHLQCEMRGINFQAKTSQMTPYALQTNTKTGKIYFKKIRYLKDGLKYRIDSVTLTIPPEDIKKEYESMKTAFTDALNREIMKEDQPIAAKKVKIDLQTLLNMDKEGIPISQQAKILNCSERTIYYTKSAANNEQIAGENE